MRDNKLFRCVGGDKECVRWVVPKGARWQLRKRNHDDIGHVDSLEIDHTDNDVDNDVIDEDNMPE